MSVEAAYDHTVPRRSDGTRRDLRPVQPWPKGKPFRILSIDGGGILGLLPCLMLAEIEERFLGGQPIGTHFDLITGTSTGGIIAMGLGQGKSARDISKLYIERGQFIFRGNRFVRKLRAWGRILVNPYNRRYLEMELRREFGNALLGSSIVPLCIPSFEGRYGEPCVFKTPHHPDYIEDQHKTLVDIGLSTAAAPTWFSAVERDGYVFSDGGIWANNPAMLGVVDALTCFDIDRRQIRLLSLGCGQEMYRMRWWHRVGGLLVWAKHFSKAAMRAQSHNALGQAGLIIGRDHLIRLDAPEVERQIAIDDVLGAVKTMPPIARSLIEAAGGHIVKTILEAPEAPAAKN